MKLVGERADAVRKRERTYGESEAKTQLKKALWLWRKNPENLSPDEQVRFDRIDYGYQTAHKLDNKHTP